MTAWWRAGGIVVIVALGSAPGAIADGPVAAPVRPGTTAAPTPDADGQATEQALRGLSSPYWRERREASNALLDQGETVLPVLHRAYHESRRHEVRLRVRELAEIIFAQRYTASLGGFLGIRQTIRLPEFDARVRAGTSAVQIEQVFPDTAAERAGLRAGDLIVGCDGTPFVEVQDGPQFSARVAGHGVGAELSVQIVRGQGDPRSLTVRLGHRPMSVIAMTDPSLFARIAREFESWWESEPAAEDQSNASTTGVARAPAAARPAPDADSRATTRPAQPIGAGAAERATREQRRAASGG